MIATQYQVIHSEIVKCLIDKEDHSLQVSQDTFIALPKAFYPKGMQGKGK
jgi:hypothetical protein